MLKLPPSVEECLAEMLEGMHRAHDAGYESAAYDALHLCSRWNMPVPIWAVAAIQSEARCRAEGKGPHKKMGRHARESERQLQRIRDGFCYIRVKQLVSRGLDWTDAIEETGQDVRRSPEAVRKAYSRVKNNRKFVYFNGLIR